MDQLPYQRVDLNVADPQGAPPPETASGGATPAESRAAALRFRWSIIPLSVLFCVAQALITILVGNSQYAVQITSTLIAVLGFAALMLLLLAINPVLKLVFRGVLFRPLNRVELTAVFCAMLVTSGISTFGLTDQLVPLVATPYNPDWNTDQRPWSKNVNPHLNPKLYISTPANASPDELNAAVQQIRGYEDLFTGAGQGEPAAQGLSEAERQRAMDAAQRVRAVLGGASSSEAELDAELAAMREALAKINRLDVVQDGQTATIARTALAYNNPANDNRLFREGATGRKPLAGDGWGAWWDYYVGVFHAVPWGNWARPLGYWLIFIFACYGMFYSLTYVVLDYWTRRDKLIFPLAKLPAALLPEPGERGLIPQALSTAGFWFGFGISFLILSYNALASAQWLPGFTPVGLGLSSNTLESMVRDGTFEGLIGYSDWPTAGLIIFTAVGLSFLLPTEVSFSIWFYMIVGKLIILFATWMGYGRTGADMPANWFWETNVVTSLGSGGILLFSAISLFRCAAEFIRAARDHRAVNRAQLMLPVIGLFICTAVMVVWLCWNWNWAPGGLLWASIFAAFLVLLTLGLMRIVAESGVYWIQVFGGGFFHYYKALALGGIFKPALLAPLMPIYSVLFLDIKTFMAPNILNAARMREDVGGSRAKFHLNLLVCILVSVGVSLALTLFIAHEKGANQMYSWFYTYFPIDLMDNVAQTVAIEPEFHTADTAWYGAGAGWVLVTLLARRSIFWFPHPIGFIMLVNPLVAKLWFSFLLGWGAKSMVVKYGGKLTFDKLRLVFIGLIMGELIAVVFWPLLGLLTGVDFGRTTLNR